VGNPPKHIYVHVPFCTRRCSYCDFAIAVRRVVPAVEYVDAIDAELRVRFPDAGAWTADTLYFGGGTPSRLGTDGVARLLDVIGKRVTLAAGAEVTLEANPEDITADSVSAWRAAGINRLSIGAQSFDDEILKWMHRSHDAAAIGRAAAAARDGGIDNVSLDLIFSLPAAAARHARSWTRDVDLALALEPSHLSLYGLTIEPHTPLGNWHSRGDVEESPDEQYEAEFLHAHRAVTAAGLAHYEVSNFGREQRHSRHNSSYWCAVPYVGLGPSAHEFDGSVRRWNASAYAEWLARVGRSEDPMAGSELLTDANRVAESVYLGLRTTGGLEISDSERLRVKPWISAGWATLGDDGRLVLTPLGWLRLDALATDLTLVRSHY
jgi:oxygen-independent coproporphyrinogen-3 oxidase